MIIGPLGDRDRVKVGVVVPELKGLLKVRLSGLLQG